MNERLLAIRKYFRLSQRDFCERLKITQSTYAPWETGKREIRDMYVRLICQAYGVNEEWFKNGTGEMFDDEKPDASLDELLNLFDGLSPLLKGYLLGQARGLRDLQRELKNQ